MASIPHWASEEASRLSKQALENAKSGDPAVRVYDVPQTSKAAKLKCPECGAEEVYILSDDTALCFGDFTDECAVCGFGY